MEAAVAPSSAGPSLGLSSSSLPRSARRPIFSTASFPSIASSLLTPLFPKNLCCRASLAADSRVPAAEIKKTYVEEIADMESFSLMNSSPLDGRYVQKVKDLRPIFSEYKVNPVSYYS